MKTHPLSRFTLLMLSFCFADSMTGAEVKLPLLATGAMSKMGGYMPQHATTTSTQPASITKAPGELSAAEFGEIKMGPAGSERTFAFIVDKPDSDTPRLFVDSNANGNLTDDAPAEWIARAPSKAKDGKEYRTAFGGFMVDLKCGEEILQVHLSAYRFDKNEPKRPHNALLYYSDYARIGTVEIGGKQVQALLTDDMAKGDFSQAKASLRLDLNGDGKYDFRGERFSVTSPFNIEGTTYELADLTPSGASFQIVKSTKTVAEVKVPVTTKTGDPAPVFEATTLDGAKIAMPGSYKGKVVLLDFWATWCGPCIGELPNVISAYEKHHAAGLEILGISLDDERSKAKLPSFIKDKKMNWPQVCDGKGWDASVGQLYNVHSIPATFLIDGDSGKVLAVGARGSALDPAITQALAAKKKP